MREKEVRLAKKESQKAKTDQAVGVYFRERADAKIQSPNEVETRRTPLLKLEWTFVWYIRLCLSACLLDLEKLL